MKKYFLQKTIYDKTTWKKYIHSLDQFYIFSDFLYVFSDMEMHIEI